MELRMWMDPTGRLLPRNLSPDEVVLATTGLKSGRAHALAAVPALHRDGASALLEELDQSAAQVDLLRRKFQNKPKAPPAPSAALLQLGDEATLGQAHHLNHLVDQQVGALGSILAGFGKLPASHPLRASADALAAVWFSEGREFLKATHELQWLAVARRLEDSAAPELAQASALLQADGLLDLISQLNERFGWLLGLLDEGTSIQEAARAAQDRNELETQTQRANLLLVRLLNLAQVLWPTDTDQDAMGRKTLVGPYLDLLVERAKLHGQRVRAGKRAEEDQDPSA